MATVTKKPVEAEATATAAEQFPDIKDVAEMPRPRRGRKGMDLEVFIDKLNDFKPHTIQLPELNDEKANKKSRERWARRLRAAGKQSGVEVETTFIPEENSLYFRGWKEGKAPARGRRSIETREAAKA
jgi:hypothetical protein